MQPVEEKLDDKLNTDTAHCSHATLTDSDIQLECNSVEPAARSESENSDNLQSEEANASPPVSNYNMCISTE